MSTPVTWNGVVYSIPAFGDTGYAQGSGNLSSYLIALAGGPFPYTSQTANPAAAGTIRLAKTDTIDWRNNANSANLPLGIDGSNNLTFNGLVVGTGGVSSITGTAHQIITSASTGNITLSTPQNIDTNSNVTFNSVTSTYIVPVFDNIDFQNTGGTKHLFLQGNPSNTFTLQLPANQGKNNSVLANDGSGNLSFAQGLTGTESLGTGSITPDATIANSGIIVVSSATTVNGPTGANDFQKFTLRIRNDASHTVTLATGAGNFRFSTDIPSYTNSVSLTDYVGAIYNGNDNVWDIVSIIQGF